MLIGYMGIARLMIYVQQVEKDQLKDREEFENKRVKTSGMNSDSKRVMLTGLFSIISRKNLLHYLLVHLHLETNVSTIVRILITSELDLRIRKVVRHKGGTKTHVCAKCGRSQSGMCRDDSTTCIKCGQNGHFMRKCPKCRQSNSNWGIRAQSSSVAPPDRAASR
ncbi:hypothetical protein MTR67_052737 [Solanum verrucosum]|uniref:CCHC-type domain-containing protein n=1 Tax=Solanum verrucosum TaxID=315347 RepID=A0AAF0V7I6_SOLVR|nr:hypothetical protein MTR67_052737 [Solanum verrucosum]